MSHSLGFLLFFLFLVTLSSCFANSPIMQWRRECFMDVEEHLLTQSADNFFLVTPQQQVLKMQWKLVNILQIISRV